MNADQAVSEISIISSKCTLGGLSQADGSALLSQDSTLVQTAVYGPIEVCHSKAFPDKATVEVVIKASTGISQHVYHRHLENHIRSIFQASLLVKLHPRSSVTIVVQDLQDHGAFLSTSINSACLALLDAAVSMKYLVASATAVIEKNGGIRLAPPEKDTVASLTFTFQARSLLIVHTVTTGRFSMFQYRQCVRMCRTASERLFSFFCVSLRDKCSRLGD